MPSYLPFLYTGAVLAIVAAVEITQFLRGRK